MLVLAVYRLHVLARFWGCPPLQVASREGHYDWGNVVCQGSHGVASLEHEVALLVLAAISAQHGGGGVLGCIGGLFLLHVLSFYSMMSIMLSRNQKHVVSSVICWKNPNLIIIRDRQEVSPGKRAWWVVSSSQNSHNGKQQTGGFF